MKKLLLFFMSLFTFLSYGQLSEGFEGATFPPTGWTTFENGIGTAQQWKTTSAAGLGWVQAGAKSAIISKENVTDGTIAEDWLVTSQVAVPTNGQLRFFARSTSNGEQGSVYKVKISTASQNTAADFTDIVVPYTEVDIINAPFEQKTISLAAYAGQNVYIAFVMENDNGDAWIIDSVVVDQECTAIPTVLLATPSNVSANLSWTYTGPATQFEIEYGPAGFVQGSAAGTIVSPVTNPHTLTGLTAATNYTYYVRALCGTNNPGPWSGFTNFTTTLCPAADRCDFIFRMTDSWGDGWNGATMQVRQAGIVVATIGGTFTGGAGPVNITVPLCNNQAYELFWNNGGGFSSEVGVQIIDPLLGTVYTMPSGSGALVNTILYSSTAFCTPPTCPRPSGVTVTAITQTQASINWTENGTATQWVVLVLPSASPAPTAATPGWRAASARPFIYTGLNSGTQYKAYVRAICDPGVDESISSNGTTFSTLIANDNCINATVTPVNDDTSCLQTASGSLVGATASTPASTCTGTADDDVWFQFVATSTTHFVTLTNIAGSTTDLYHVLYSGSCGSLTRLYCSDAESSTANGLTIGQTYFVRVYSWTSTAGQTSTFNLCIGTPVTCSDANAFCGDTGLVYTNSTGAPSYGSIGCLSTTPNPSWYYMQVNQAGSLNFQIAQTDNATGAGIDVDYIIWGPFTPAQFATSCNNLYDFPDGNTTIPNNVASCSYSWVSVENFTIANANLNDIYIVLITNYSDDPGTVTFTQTGGTGATNCDIVCNIDLGPDRILCDTASTQIVASNTTADSYAWYFNNVLMNGVVSSSITVSQSGTYKCVITCGINEVEDEIILTFNTALAPTFTAIAPFCKNTVAPVLPTTSNNGIPGTWNPSVISNTASGSYTFTPDAGLCASPLTISVTVNDETVPTFVTPAPICSGDAAPVLSTTSNNGITGTWLPAIVSNTISDTYTFTPDMGQCATTVTLNVQVLATCSFGTIASAVLLDDCNTAANGEFFNTTSGTQNIGAVANVFPNSNLGTYVQASGNLMFNGAELRTFKTVTSNVCSARLNYRVYLASSAPGVFSVVNLPLLEDCTAGTYPTGGASCLDGDQRWQNISTAIDLTANTPGNYIIEVYYDVTGDNDNPTQCDDTIVLDNGGTYYSATFSIQSTPTFVSANPSTCNGTEGSITISGFNPGDTYSLTYTDDAVTVGPANFTADVNGDIVITALNAGVYSGFNFVINGCTITDAISITLINPVYNPTFNQVGPYCVGDAVSLPLTSIEGYTGTWSPAIDNTQTITYTFNPDAGQCATVFTTYTVTVNPAPSVTNITSNTPICFGEDAIFTVTGSASTTLTYAIGSGVAQTTTFDASGSATITVTAPAVGNVVLNLSDIDNGACNTALTNSSTVIVRALPTVTSLTATNASICLGSDAEFTIQGTADATVTYTIGSGAAQTVDLDATGSATVTVSNPTVDVVILLSNINDGTCNNTASNTFTIVVNSVPTPTIDITSLPTCADQTATFEVLSPVNSVLNTPGNLFISEVTDATAGALTYVEIYNGTGATVDLSEYKLKVYNNGNATPSTNCDMQLSGSLLNNDVVVIKLSSSPNIAGVPVDLSYTLCPAMNNNDEIRLSTFAGDVDLDIWGTNGISFTPGAGYTYRRLTSATPLPSTTWNAADWTVLDPEDYTDVGSYSLYVSDYEYILNDGTTTTTQTSVDFTGVTPGTYTLIAHDLITGCYSLPYTFTIDPSTTIVPVLAFTYASPVCIADTVNPLPDTSIAGFNTGGTFTGDSADVTVNSLTGEIDLATSLAGTYTITYTFNADIANCINAGTSQYEIVINAYQAPTFNNANVCVGSTFQLPLQSLEGYDGTWSPTVADVSTVNTTTYYFTPNNPTSCSEIGELTVVVSGSQAILTFTYSSPVCISNSVNPLPDTSAAGFNTGGTFTGNNSNIVVDSSTGEVDLSTSFAGTYIITYTLASDITNCLTGGTSQYELIITDSDVPTFNNEEVCLGSDFQLPLQSLEGYAGTWSPSVVNVSATGTTSYYFTPNNSCSEVGELIVDVIACEIPKGISPNGDGLNDNWDLSGFDIKKVEIFNRYGKEVYSKSNYSNEWSGKSNNGNELPDGTYYYVIQFNDMASRTGWVYINREY